MKLFQIPEPLGCLTGVVDVLQQKLYLFFLFCSREVLDLFPCGKLRWINGSVCCLPSLVNTVQTWKCHRGTLKVCWRMCSEWRVWKVPGFKATFRCYTLYSHPVPKVLFVTKLDDSMKSCQSFWRLHQAALSLCLIQALSHWHADIFILGTGIKIAF